MYEPCGERGPQDLPDDVVALVRDAQPVSGGRNRRSARRALRLNHADAAVNKANATYAPDQPYDCSRVVTHGSSAKGYPSSASIDARLESANNRYGLFPGKLRANHACTSGLVVDSRKYGRPMVAARRPRMRSEGLSLPSGFHCAPGTIGSSAQLKASSAMCSHIAHWGKGDA